VNAFEKGLGVDLYTAHGRLRTDDQAVRARAAELLARAAAALCTAAAAYQRLYVPAPSREQPFPSAESLAPARKADALAAELTSMSEAIRSAGFPDPGRLWQRLSAGGAAELVNMDLALISQSEYVAAAVGEVSAEGLTELDGGRARDALRDLRVTLDARTAWLSR
jgi:hypothetical protein